MDGEAALELAREELPDLILLDVMIPKVDGLEVCRLLKEDTRTRGIMILLVTGRDTVDNRVEGFEAGADDYIPKPFHIPEMLARVRSSLRIKHLTDDLAERNRLLVKSQKDLVHSEKMATLGLLASGIAHEFNNIMAGISGYAQLARRDPKYRELLVDVAMTQTERALELTRSLSTYNKTNDTDYSCDVVKVIESALCLVAKEMERSGTRIVKDYSTRPRVRMRAGQFQEVLLNLVLNAIQATDDGEGTVRILVQDTDQPEHFFIEVTDNGNGIQETDLEKIFDPFFTTKGALGGGAQSGTGLGLTVCYNIVKSHSGALTVESQVGQGTTFRITFPRACEPATGEDPTPKPAAKTTPKPPDRPLRILVVDDEEPIRELLRDYLANHEVECCTTGEAAVAAHSSQPFDFVILDVCMHDSLNGFQTFERLERLTPAPRIIFASGRFPDEAYSGYLQRAHGHLLKPFKFDDLAALLRQ